MLPKISVSENDEQDCHDLDFEIIPQDDLDPDTTPILNQKPKWSQKIIEETGNGVGNPDDRRRTRSQYQNEHVALSFIVFLPSEWCNKLPERRYMMVRTDQQLG